MSQFHATTPDVNITTAVATPTDRVRWGPIIAGLFAALSTLVVLSVLGIAVAGSAFDPGDNARNYGIGAGIWGAISMLLAFFIGGWLASRSAAVRGHGSGVLNGAMVWVVTIPLLLYMLMGGIGSLFRTAGNVTTAGVQAAGNAAGQLADRTSDPADRQRIEDQARTASARIAATTQQAGQQINQAINDPNNQQQAAKATAKGAWGTLVSLLLGLGAAAAGGWVGARDRLHFFREHGETR